MEGRLRDTLFFETLQDLWFPYRKEYSSRIKLFGGSFTFYSKPNQVDKGRDSTLKMKGGVSNAVFA